MLCRTSFQTARRSIDGFLHSSFFDRFLRKPVFFVTVFALLRNVFHMEFLRES